MLTPSQIKNYEFKAAGRNAYKAEDVDIFFGEVLVNYEKLYRENIEFSKRISLLADRLEKYKAEDVDIKQAVLSAQKAADIIKKDAEDTAKQMKEEAESVLAAAKGEADIIKSDAEKQAIADSDLLLAMARDKAEEIIKKAKEKAHGILIAANNSASDTVGAANRTITSESIHYDMLKKEVSEFRASILAQYKAHIEMISKLPELAVEEAGKIETVTPEVEVSVDDLEEFEVVENTQAEDTILEFDESAEFTDTTDNTETVEESVVNDCTEDDSNDLKESNESEFANSNEVNESHYADIPISKKLTINTDDLVFEGFDDEPGNNDNDLSLVEETDDDVRIYSGSNTEASLIEDDENESDDVVINTDTEPMVYEDVYSNDNSDAGEEPSSTFEDASENVHTEEAAQSRRERYSRMLGENEDNDESANDNNSFSSFFDSIETIDSEDTPNEPNPKNKFSFFRKKK